MWGRLALSTPPEASHRASDATTSVSSQPIALGVCWSPWYDTRGLVVLGCVESGVTLMGTLTSALDGSRVQSKTSGFGTVGPLVEVEYNLGGWLHVAGKVGVSGVMGKVAAERADAASCSTRGGWAVHGDVGLGFLATPKRQAD